MGSSGGIYLMKTTTEHVYYNIAHDDFEIYGPLTAELFLHFLNELGLIYLGEL